MASLRRGSKSCRSRRVQSPGCEVCYLASTRNGSSHRLRPDRRSLLVLYGGRLPGAEDSSRSHPGPLPGGPPGFTAGSPLSGMAVLSADLRRGCSSRGLAGVSTPQSIAVPWSLRPAKVDVALQDEGLNDPDSPFVLRTGSSPIMHRSTAYWRGANSTVAS